MKASETDIHFPVFGFKYTDYALETGWLFPDRDSLTTCEKKELDRNRPQGVELIDAMGQRWMIKSVTKLGRHGHLLLWLLRAMLEWKVYRVDYELEALPPSNLFDVQDRVCMVHTSFGQLNDYFEENKVETAGWIADARAAPSIPLLADQVTWWGGFE